jgi:hypothetical protein
MCKWVYLLIYIYIYGQQVTTSVGWFSIFFVVVGEPLESVPSYCYFLKEPPGKVLNFFIKKIQNFQLRSMFLKNIGGSPVLGFKFLKKGQVWVTIKV